MLFRLLVAVDDSPNARAAVERAVLLGKAVGQAEVTALHVVNVVAPSGSFIKDLPGRLGFEPAVVSKQTEEEHDETGRRILAEAKFLGEQHGVAVRTVLEHGAVTDRILHHAQHSDLLVIGNAGETAARFPDQGSNHVYNLISGCSVPVLLVPPGSPAPGVAVIGYDGSVAASRALAALRRLSSKAGEGAGLVVHAVFVSINGSEPGDSLQQVANQLPHLTVVTHEVQAESVRAGLVQVAEEVGAATVALGFRGNNRMRDFLFGSSSEFLLGEQRFALLIAP